MIYSVRAAGDRLPLLAGRKTKNLQTMRAVRRWRTGRRAVPTGRIWIDSMNAMPSGHNGASNAPAIELTMAPHALGSFRRKGATGHLFVEGD
jgi:hypothetical protein